MILIADSGSTKTDWALVSVRQSASLSLERVVSTQGLNPFHQSAGQIRSVLQGELLPALQGGCDVDSVCFYGSGVRPEKVPVMVGLLREAFPEAAHVEAHGDLLGAARAICGHNSGIASILGTGSNACLYDGERIVCNRPALGYILGDEGSGAVLGKRFLHDVYGGILSEKIKRKFESETGLTLPEIIDKVYQQPLANRFLASLAPFIHSHLGDPSVAALVRRNFGDFFRIHISPYGRQDLPVGFVGSIAHYFETQLREAASEAGITVGRILRTPLEGLVHYHCEN